jgi:hypothetical protein
MCDGSKPSNLNVRHGRKAWPLGIRVLDSATEGTLNMTSVSPLGVGALCSRQQAGIGVGEFLQRHGWVVRPGDRIEWMQIALGFFQDKIPAKDLSQAAKTPWQIHPTVLSSYMQAIDFRQPVRRLWAKPGDRFKHYYFAGDRRREQPNPRGTHWFGRPSDKQESAGIHHEQATEEQFVVTKPVECLESIASDAFTWLRATEEQIEQEGYRDKYFRGGGRQYFIWESDRLKRTGGG